MSGLPIVQLGVLDAIQAHVNSAWARKVGGILLGRPVDDLVQVEGVVPAHQVEPYAGEIAFPPLVWEEAYAALDQYPGAKIIGWYHSHPGNGVNLSDYDRQLHKTLFGEATNLALVLDPIGEKLAWFGWTLSDLSVLGRGEAAESRTFKVVPRPQGRSRRAAMAGLVAVGLAAGAVGGYSLSSWRGDHRPASAESLTRLVQAQRGQIGRLRQALQQARQTARENEARLGELQGNLDAAKRALREARKKLREAEHAGPTTVLRYRVRAGDSLWDLARTFYGDPLTWPKIVDANRARLSDPGHLRIGQVLSIPLGT
jgi:nucleoid-associated protein YgaU/proteasome lid subunit RPN8/RPN11